MSDLTTLKLMDCKEIAEQDVLERYLCDQLSESEQDAFEQHYFECKDCFEQVQVASAVQEAGRTPRTVRRPAIAAHSSGLPLWWNAAVALVVVIVIVGTWQYRKLGIRSTSQAIPAQTTTAEVQTPQATMIALSRIEPPPYSSVVLRGAEDEATQEFHNAMRHYLNKDYASAIPGLRRATQMNAQAANANFYLGACYLLTNETDLAIQALTKTISLDDSNYAEPAHFYLAKAYIRKNDLLTARVQLEKTVQLHGDREHEARQLEQQLTQLTRARQ